MTDLNINTPWFVLDTKSYIALMAAVMPLQSSHNDKLNKMANDLYKLIFEGTNHPGKIDEIRKGLQEIKNHSDDIEVHMNINKALELLPQEPKET